MYMFDDRGKMKRSENKLCNEVRGSEKQQSSGIKPRIPGLRDPYSHVTVMCGHVTAWILCFNEGPLSVTMVMACVSVGDPVCYHGNGLCFNEGPICYHGNGLCLLPW